MKQYLILILSLSLGLPAMTFGKEKGAAADEASLKKIEQDITDGILKGDTGAIEKYVTSDYLGIGPDPRRGSRRFFLT
jgi:hypothetical protein